MADNEPLTELNKVEIRKLHPTLYRELMTVGVGQVALALNFWKYTPTFNPLGIHKNFVGLVFFTLGAGFLVFLNLFRSLKTVRLMQLLSFLVTFFWGLINTRQAFAGNASFQLPITFTTLSAFQAWLLIESPVNPATRKQ